MNPINLLKHRKFLPFFYGIILLILLVGWIYSFPLYRYMAEQKLIEYMSQQGASTAEILSKDVYKDYTQGGYYIAIVYSDDPDYTYTYHYYLLEPHRTGTKFDTMSCTVFNMRNESVQKSEYHMILYPPI